MEFKIGDFIKVGKEYLNVAASENSVDENLIKGVMKIISLSGEEPYNIVCMAEGFEEKYVYFNARELEFATGQLPLPFGNALEAIINELEQI